MHPSQKGHNTVVVLLNEKCLWRLDKKKKKLKYPFETQPKFLNLQS